MAPPQKVDRAGPSSGILSRITRKLFPISVEPQPTVARSFQQAAERSAATQRPQHDTISGSLSKSYKRVYELVGIDTSAHLALPPMHTGANAFGVPCAADAGSGYEQANSTGRPLTLLDMPPEIHRQILLWLPAGDRILVSLTCKNLWARRAVVSSNWLKTLLRETPRSERLETLMIMERDLPNHIVCPVCEKLEKRAGLRREAKMLTTSRFDVKALKIVGPCSRSQPLVDVEDSLTCDKTAFIRRRMLDLIIRGATLGPAFGLPTSSLKHTISHQEYGLKAHRVNIALSGRVVTPPGLGDLHLFLCSQQDFEIDLHCNHQAQVQAVAIQACHHARGSRQQTLICDSVRSLQRRPAEVLSLRSDVIKCHCCPTDMQVILHKDSQHSVFAKVTLIAWRDLGPRGCHSNPIWTAQTGPYPDRFDRTANHYPFGTRSLKDAWEYGRCTF